MAAMAVYGVGVSDIRTSEMVGGKQIFFEFYNRWVGILERCYFPKLKDKNSYADCEVVPEWHKLSAYKAWFDKQTYRREGWQIDKDYLAPAMPGKLYGPDTCCFLPSSLNGLFINNGAKLGEYPLGVDFHKKDKRFRARLRVDRKSVHLGYFDTPEEAYEAYVMAKIDYVNRKLGEIPLPPSLKSRVVAGAERQLETLLSEAMTT